MGRGIAALFVVLLIILSAGCLKGGNFVYSKGKTLSPGKELDYTFKGPMDLKVKISSSVPVEVKIVGENTVLKDFGKVREVDTVVKLPEGKWEVVIKNPGEEKATLDIELKGS